MRYFAFLTKASLRYFEVPLNNYLIYRYSCLNLAALHYRIRLIYMFLDELKKKYPGVRGDRGHLSLRICPCRTSHLAV